MTETKLDSKLKSIPTKQIQFDETNPNRMTKKQFEGLKQSIEKYGFTKPVWVRTRAGSDGYHIIDGEHRAKAAIDLGLKSVKAYVFEKLDDKQMRVMRQLANKLHGKHDKMADALDLQAILNDGNLTSLSEIIDTPVASMEHLINKKLDLDIPEETPKQPKPKAKRGDMYRLGNHTILCGDATVDLPRLLSKSDVTLLLTDPPYGIDIVSKRGHIGEESYDNKTHRKLKSPPVTGDDKPFQPSPILPYGKIKILFGANNYASKLLDSPRWLVWDKKFESGSQDTTDFSDVELAWVGGSKKRTCKIYRHLWSGLIRSGPKKDELQSRIHPNQKPVALMAEIIQDYSRPGDIVLDPYLGSGSTLIACEKENRICYGMEIEPYYVDAIISRWETFTGNKAVKIT